MPPPLLPTLNFRTNRTILRKGLQQRGLDKIAEYVITLSMELRSPAGPRRLGTATRISASLFRRLSAFFGSTPDQGAKAAKFAVLTPGHAGFPNRVKRSEGSNSAPIRNAPVSACKPLCAILLAKASVYPLSLVKANVGRLCERLKNAMKDGLR